MAGYVVILSMWVCTFLVSPGLSLKLRKRVENVENKIGDLRDEIGVSENKLSRRINSTRISLESEMSAVKKTVRNTLKSDPIRDIIRDAVAEQMSPLKESNVQIKRQLYLVKQELEQIKEDNRLLKEVLKKDVCCPDDFLRFYDSCYWFSDFKVNFTDARAHCQFLKSHLAVITCKAEDDFVREIAKNRTGHHFLGATDLATEGVWKWEGGLKMTYTNWAPGEPSGHVYTYTNMKEHCLDIMPGGGNTYLWNDELCTSEVKFICERERM